MKNSNFSKYSNILFPLLLFLSINGLFILKYAERVTSLSYLIVILYVSFAFVVIYFVHRLINRYRKLVPVFFYFIMLVIIVGVVLLHMKVDPYALNIDRWSAIHNFIHNVFQGVYPYSAKTHLDGYGSPFPIWQLFHIPFYFLGNISVALLFVILLTAYVLVKFTKDKKSSLYFFLLVVISPAFWYEALARSDLFYNFLLLSAILIWINEKKINIGQNALFLGAICGLFLSTRLSVVIPFFIYFLADFLKAENKNKLFFLSAIILVFLITFLPLAFWNFDMLLFFEYNPFVLQSRQGSLFEVITVLIVSVLFALKWNKDFVKYNEYTAYAIIILVIVTFVHRMISSGFSNNLFSSAYDITYFNMALPFLIFCISYGFNSASNKKLKEDN
ncbi:MAG: hypothetical protein ACK5KP_12150 [Paludibacteraceae bacterium]